MLARQAAHALAFGAHHQRQRAFQVCLIKALRGLAGRTVDPDTALLKRRQGATEVGHRHQVHFLGSATGHLTHRQIHRRGIILGHDHRIHACGIGRAQAGAQVMRIGDFIQYQQQRRMIKRFQQLIKKGFVFGGIAPLTQGNHALMHGQPIVARLATFARRAAQLLFQLVATDLTGLEAKLRSQCAHLVQTFVIAILLQPKLQHVLRITLQ